MGKMQKRTQKVEPWPHIVRVQPFDWNIHIVAKSNLAGWFNYIMKLGEDPTWCVSNHQEIEKLLESGGAHFYSDDQRNYVLMLPDKFKAELVYHEALHAAVCLWHDAGANLILPDNDEVLTYTTDHIVRLVKQHYKSVVSNEDMSL